MGKRWDLGRFLQLFGVEGGAVLKYILPDVLGHASVPRKRIFNSIGFYSKIPSIKTSKISIKMTSASINPKKGKIQYNVIKFSKKKLQSKSAYVI